MNYSWAVVGNLPIPKFGDRWLSEGESLSTQVKSPPPALFRRQSFELGFFFSFYKIHSLFHLDPV
jgi:hypothetical protein